MLSVQSDKQQPQFVALRRLACAGTTAAIAAAATNPVEVIRVRFQLESAATRPPSVYDFALRLARDEGLVRGLMQPGVSAWMASMGVAFRPTARTDHRIPSHHSPNRHLHFSCRMVLYEPLRDAIEGASGVSTPATAFAAGLSTGALTNSLACPFFNVKALQQSAPSSSSSLAASLALVSRSAGWAGHYRGVSALFVR